MNTHTNSSLREIEARLADWLIRLRLRDALLWSVRGLAIGLAIGLGLSLAARLRPLLPVPTLGALAVALGLAGFGLALGLAYFWPRPRLLAARRFDQLFGLAERTSTALELAGNGAGAPAWLVRDQWADAAAAARRVEPGRHLRLRLDPRELLAVALVAAALGASLYLPNPQQAILAEQLAIEQTIAEQIQALEEVRAAIEDNPNLTDEQKAALLEPLDEALEQLRQGGLTQEQAVQILADTQRQLNALADPNAQAQAEALQDAADALSQNPVTEDAGQALAEGDLQGAAEALSGLDLSQLSAEEQLALAEQLEAAAAQLANSNPDVAAQLQAAADALRAGDTAAAEAALDGAAQAISDAAAAAAAADAAATAAGQVADAQTAVAQAGGQGQGQGQGQGEGQGQGQGEGQGQGQGEGQGQGGNGSGQGEGSGQGSGAGQGEGSGEGQGGTAGTDPIGQDNGPGDGGERAYEEIYSPYHVGGGGGTDVTVGSGGDPSGEVVGEGTTNPNSSGDVTVPYNEVYAGYLESVYEAIGSGTYPLDMQDIIRDYFSSLQPR